MKIHHKKMFLLFTLMLIVSPSGWAGGSDMDYYLGSEHKGNYVWGGAMNLAWHDLNENILHEKLKLNTKDQVSLEMVDKLNNSPFTRNDLNEKSYYVKSGFGQETVDRINNESRQRFPNKSFSDLKMKLSPLDIISYAYFLKEVEYWIQFTEKEVLFDEEMVKGFYVKLHDHQENINILKYWSDDRFIISIKLKDDTDELFILKGFDMKKPQDTVDEIVKYNKADLPLMDSDDQFEMPKLHIMHQRDYMELTQKNLANKRFEKYLIAAMYENIKFDMDHKGARVENEAVISMPLAAPIERSHNIKKFILDKPFWVVMKRKESVHPYFILGVKNTELMEKIK